MVFNSFKMYFVLCTLYNGPGISFLKEKDHFFKVHFYQNVHVHVYGNIFIAANISKFQLVVKPTETNCPLVFEAILIHDSTLNTRRMLKLPIARLHSGGRHDETVGSSLVITHYYVA